MSNDRVISGTFEVAPSHSLKGKWGFRLLHPNRMLKYNDLKALPDTVDAGWELAKGRHLLEFACSQPDLVRKFPVAGRPEDCLERPLANSDDWAKSVSLQVIQERLKEPPYAWSPHCEVVFEKKGRLKWGKEWDIQKHCIGSNYRFLLVRRMPS